MRDVNSLILEYINTAIRQMKAQPLNLGGITASGGGAGGPPGGYVGYLPQTRVAYDESELELITTSGTPSLLDNLNHVRYRLKELEEQGTKIIDDLSSQVPSSTFVTTSSYLLNSLEVYYNGIREVNFSGYPPYTEFGVDFVTYSGDSIVAVYNHYEG